MHSWVYKTKAKCYLFLNTAMEHLTNARFVKQYSLKLLTRPKVEGYAHTDMALRF